jgi:hypothetical protein
MSDLTFSQSERRSFLVPGIIVAVLVVVAFALIYFFTPHRIADLSVTRTAVLPTHTAFKSSTKVVGLGEQAQDDLYVLTTVRIDDKLRLPLIVNDITGTLTSADGTETDTSAIEKLDLPNLYVTFPALVPLSSAPLLRETEIAPGGHAEGMVILHFPVDQATWDQRKSATVTINLYHQGEFTVTIPKP